MILLSVDSVRKHFREEAVLSSVTFDIRPGERVGLVGPNGTGKTTLMKIIAGREDADGGKVEFHPSVRMGYLEQQPDYAAGRTLIDEARHALANLLDLQKDAEAVAHALAEETDPQERKRLEARFDHLQTLLHTQDAYNIDYKIDKVLAGLGFARSQFDTEVALLSGGEQNRLMLAKLLLAEPDLMLLDEPSNHLDIEATEWLEEFLVNSPAATLVVSHDRYFLDKTTTRTLELFQGTIESYAGNFSSYWRQKDDRLLVQTRTYEKQREEIAKAEDFIRRNHYGMKAAQAEDRRKKLERIELVDPPRTIESPAMGFAKPERSGDVPLKASKLAKAYDQPLFENVSFEIQRGERWGILGPNGAGKTTLLRCLLGLEKPDAGESRFGHGVKLGYFDQQLHEVPDDALVIDSILPPKEEIVRTGESKGGPKLVLKEFDEPKRRSMLARFGLVGPQVFQKVASLSGGERCRAALARLCALEANFLVLDEPTNHLDLWARDGLERSLKNFDGTVLFVSHDRYFINQTADHLIVVEPDEVKIVEGNYEIYQIFKKRAEAEAKQKAEAEKKKAEQAAAANQKQEKSTTTRKRKFPYRKLNDLETEIAQREQELANLQQKSLDPAVLRDGAAVKKVQQDLADVQEKLDYLYEHWEEAAELNW